MSRSNSASAADSSGDSTRSRGTRARSCDGEMGRGDRQRDEGREFHKQRFKKKEADQTRKRSNHKQELRVKTNRHSRPGPHTTETRTRTRTLTRTLTRTQRCEPVVSFAATRAAAATAGKARERCGHVSWNVRQTPSPIKTPEEENDARTHLHRHRDTDTHTETQRCRDTEIQRHRYTYRHTRKRNSHNTNLKRTLTIVDGWDVCASKYVCVYVFCAKVGGGASVRNCVFVCLLVCY